MAGLKALAKLGLDVSEFQTGLNIASRHLGTFAEGASQTIRSKLGGKLLGVEMGSRITASLLTGRDYMTGGAVGLSAQSFAKLTQHAMALRDFARATGETAERLQTLKLLAEATGGKFEDFKDILTQLGSAQKAALAGDAGMLAAFQGLGIGDSALRSNDSMGLMRAIGGHEFRDKDQIEAFLKLAGSSNAAALPIFRKNIDGIVESLSGIEVPSGQVQALSEIAEFYRTISEKTATFLGVESASASGLLKRGAYGVGSGFVGLGKLGLAGGAQLLSKLFGGNDSLEEFATSLLLSREQTNDSDLPKQEALRRKLQAVLDSRPKHAAAEAEVDDVLSGVSSGEGSNSRGMQGNRSDVFQTAWQRIGAATFFRNDRDSDALQKIERNTSKMATSMFTTKGNVPMGRSVLDGEFGGGFN